jgi:UDP-N-acetylmuramoyl-tripeptide--D-alanyl-D-alanine ligase
VKPVSLQQVAKFCGGTLLQGKAAAMVSHVSTDSRKITAGDVFVALKGEKFDAHSYLEQVDKAGAAAVLVSQPVEAVLGCAVIQVQDTLVGLQALAQAYRAWHQPLVIGITGSNGKTSTKDLACAVMAKKHQVCATPGNLNNHIGLPLSILGLREGDTCGVFEMGMNHPGEIAPLAAIASPNAAIITNVGVAHIEYMGSREAIALEKGMLAEAVQQSGVVVLNANDEFTPSIAARCQACVIKAGIGAGDVSAQDLRAAADGTHFTLSLGGGQFEAFLPIPGEHMVGNATLAAALGWSQGIAPEDIVAALREVIITQGRLETKRVNGVTFLDDSYNANPDSMKAGLRTLAGLECSGRRVAVLGRMGELGEHAESGHREVGAYAAGLGLDAILSVGDEARWITDEAKRDTHFPDHAACAAFLQTYLSPGDLVLLKGSRSAGMERVLSLYQTA